MKNRSVYINRMDDSNVALLRRLASDTLTHKLRGIIWPLRTKTHPEMDIGCYSSDTTICADLKSRGRWEIFNSIEQAGELYFSERKNRTFVDLGANIGLCSIYLAARGNWRGVAVEPLFGDLLTLNAITNNVHDKIRLVRAAVGEVSGQTRINLEVNNPGGSSGGGNSGMVVPLKTINEVISEAEAAGYLIANSSIDYVKLDIEGFELRALGSADKMLAGGRTGLLQFEFHHDNMEKLGAEPIKLLELISSYGYKIYRDLNRVDEVKPENFKTFVKFRHFGDLFAFSF